MKKIGFTLLLIFGALAVSWSQKSIVIDVTYILEKQDSYEKAQDQLDQLAATWRQDIAEEHDKIKSLYNKYQAEQVLLSDEMKRQREEEIMTNEKAVMNMQKQKFGPEGELFKKRQELVQPIQDKVYGAIESFASDRGYDIVFDTSGTIIYVSPDYDKTDDIIRKLK